MPTITLSDEAIALYDQLHDATYGKYQNYDPATTLPTILYESQKHYPNLVLLTAGTATDARIHVNRGHLFPKTGTVLLADWDTNTYEFVNYKRVVNDTGHGNNPPSYDGSGTEPGAWLVLETALVNNYTLGYTDVYIVDSQISGLVPPAGSMLPGHMFAKFLTMLKTELAPAGALTTTGDGSLGGTTVVDAGAFTGVNSQVGNAVTIESTPTHAAPEGETSYVISNTANALTVFPAFTDKVPLNATYSIEVTFFDDIIEKLEAELPRKLDPISGNATAGMAYNFAVNSTAVVDACVKIMVQLGTGTAPSAYETLLRGQVGTYLAPFTFLTRKHLIGETELEVVNADILPSIPYDEASATWLTEDVYVSATGATLTMDKNYRNKRNGSGPHKIRLDAALLADLNVPCMVMWVRSSAADKKEQFLLGKPVMSAQSGLPAGIPFQQYLTALRTAIELYTVPV